jgi:hypothetical protein
MKLCSKAILAAFLTLFSACSLDEGDKLALLIFSEEFDFNEGEHGWIHGFSDYPADPADSSLFDLTYAYTDDLPESILTKRSIMLSGKNLNKDLFMYLKKEITGLKPDTDYTLTFNVELASDLSSNSADKSGSVFLKAGAILTEPKSVIASGNYVMNIDKGDQEAAGKDMVSLGDIATPTTNTGYTLISRNNIMADSRCVARTNSDGSLWLIIGTDSNLEGTTTVFFTRVSIVFSAS